MTVEMIARQDKGHSPSDCPDSSLLHLQKHAAALFIFYMSIDNFHTDLFLNAQALPE